MTQISVSSGGMGRAAASASARIVSTGGSVRGSGVFGEAGEIGDAGFESFTSCIIDLRAVIESLCRSEGFLGLACLDVLPCARTAVDCPLLCFVCAVAVAATEAFNAAAFGRFVRVECRLTDVALLAVIISSPCATM